MKIEKHRCNSCQFCLYDEKLGCFACFNEDSPNFYTAIDKENFKCDEYIPHDYSLSLLDALEAQLETDGMYLMMKDKVTSL